jgi:hypothetical protein
MAFTYTQPYVRVNEVLLGQAAALLIIAALVERQWWAIPLLSIPLAFSHSRGAWAALALGVFSQYVRQPLLIAVLILLGALALTLHPTKSDAIRLHIWFAAFQYLSLLGHGLGSFMSLWYADGGTAVHPINAHNDFLQLAFEFGLGAIPLFAVFGFAVFRHTHPAWPILVAFLFMASFSFPLYNPTTTLVGSVALASILRETIYA